MKPESPSSAPRSKSSSDKDPNRCQYRTGNGARCRQRALNASSAFCFNRARMQLSQQDTADLSEALGAQPSGFQSALQINDFLSKLLVLLAQNRISSRRASVMAYITNQLLRSLVSHQWECDEAERQESERQPQIVIDLPRPLREPPIQPPVQPS